MPLLAPMSKTLLQSALLGIACCALQAADKAASPAPAKPSADFHAWAPTPPMGWNSWDCFATTITEQQTKEQAAYMAERLLSYGWNTLVVDIQWYEPGARDHGYRKDAVLAMDGYGRLQPAINRFPSSAEGKGFGPLAEHIHSLGLKFGIHLMRGIPRQAVQSNLPILGTQFRAQDIADREHICTWNPDMYGVDMSKPGAQEYYDSVFALIASWGVDYVKVDDLSRPYFQNIREVEAIRRAIDKTGRPMVLSLSPGATDPRAASHVSTHANLWRISDDFWDRWLALKEQFARLDTWSGKGLPGAWPDADMLPLGTLMLGQRTTRFTPDEQYTLMTLWCIAHSPLMHGGDMTKTDAFTLALLTNDEVLAVNQRSTDNKQLFNKDGLIAWTAKDPATGDTYLALFNTRDRVALTEANSRQPAAVVTKDASSAAQIDIPVADGQNLFLVAEPITQGDSFTPMLWENPRWVLEDRTERPIISEPWVKADAQWDSAAAKQAVGDSPATLRAQASAVIEYAIPEKAARFKARVSIDPAQKIDGDPHIKVLTVVGTDMNEDRGAGLPVEVDLAALGFPGGAKVRDLWTRSNLGPKQGKLAPIVPFHGTRLYRLTKP